MVNFRIQLCFKCECLGKHRLLLVISNSVFASRLNEFKFPFKYQIGTARRGAVVKPFLHARNFFTGFILF